MRNLIELPGMNRQRIGYSRFMSKVLFGNLDSINKVDVPLVITHMRTIFESYPLDQPIYWSLSEEKRRMLEATQTQANQAPLDHLKPFS